MMRPSILAWLLAMPLAAQGVPPGLWHGWSASILGPGGVAAFAADGTVLASFVINGTVPVLAKHPQGFVFVGVNTNLVAYDLAGPTGLQFPAPAGGTISRLAVAANGDLFVTVGLLFAPPVLHRLTSTGALLGSWPLTGSFVSSLSADPFGGVWIAEVATSGFLVRHLDAVGTLGPVLPVPGANNVTVLADPSGKAVALSADGILSRIDPSGTVLFAVVTPMVVGLTLDVCGRPVTLTSGLPRTLQVFDVSNGALAKTIPFSGVSGAVSAVTQDAAGNTWLSAASPAPPTLSVFDRQGNAIATIPIATTASLSGDPTGRALASVTHPLLDLDLDGFTSQHELRRGSDPFDGVSVPATLSLAGGQVGLPLSITGTFPQDAGAVYAIGASFGSSSISLLPADCRLVPLEFDALFLAWFDPAINVVTVGQIGVVPPSGSVGASLILPALPPGTALRFAYVSVVPPDRFLTITDAQTLTIP